MKAVIDHYLKAIATKSENFIQSFNNDCIIAIKITIIQQLLK